MNRSSTCTWISQLTSWPSVKKQNGIETIAIVTQRHVGKLLGRMHVREDLEEVAVAGRGVRDARVAEDGGVERRRGDEQDQARSSRCRRCGRCPGSENVRAMNTDAMVRDSFTSCHGIMPRMTIVISM